MQPLAAGLEHGCVCKAGFDHGATLGSGSAQEPAATVEDLADEGRAIMYRAAGGTEIDAIAIVTLCDDRCASLWDVDDDVLIVIDPVAVLRKKHDDVAAAA
jgi:hypothetical protein